ncbi:MAG TPA: RelA/SpoT family protein [Candidatus Onthoplasma faecipullorum]|nr:RelA/SpoT family protein [Candidatus Onthoplasma faecipullorum]
MKEELIKKIKDNFTLNEKEQKIIEEYIIDDMNLQRLSFVIDTMITYHIQSDFLVVYIVYTHGKINEEKAEVQFKKFNKEEKRLYESFKLLRDVTTLNRGAEAEDIRHLFLAICQDMRMVIVKFASLLYDLKQIKLPMTQQDREFVKMVKEIFAPLAERLGLNRFKNDFEDITFELLEPDAYNRLKNEALLKTSVNQKQIELTTKKLRKILHELNIEGEIQSRQKHFYSVYKKLTTKNIPLGKVYDLVAMRVIVNTVEDCYAVLGKIHAIYKPIPGRVKDYIANPKPNGYQSLHTTIVADNTRPLEIQIRTHEMHRLSEYGVAAHWIYKEKRTQTKADKKFVWFRQMLENSKDLDNEEFLQTLKSDLYGEAIVVQTPKGKVLEFPLGSTILDFAYAIHSEIGNKCVGARINGKMVPITTKLKNADVVEIITNPNSKGPSRDWLKYVKTTSARSKIRAFFKSEHKDENIKTGKTILDQNLKAKSITLSKEEREEFLTKIASGLMIDSIDGLLAEIGAGSISISSVVNKIAGFISKERLESITNKNVLTIKRNKDGILVDGDGGLLIRYAGCCTPVVGDDIIGYISRGRGVTIHRRECINVKNLEPERLIKVEWQKDLVSDFITTIKVETENNPKMIKVLTDYTRELKGKLKGFGYMQVQDKLQFQIVVQIKNKSELDSIIKNIKSIKNVQTVYRSE